MTVQGRAPQVIRADEAYSVAEFRRRVGLGDNSFRHARKAGLRVVMFGQKRWVLGSDWLAFLKTRADDSAAPDSGAAIKPTPRNGGGPGGG